MTLLKVGKVFDPLWYGECAACGSIFSAKTEELSNFERGDSFLDFAFFSRARCENCKIEINDKGTIKFFNAKSKTGQEIKRKAEL